MRGARGCAEYPTQTSPVTCGLAGLEEWSSSGGEQGRGRRWWRANGGGRAAGVGVGVGDGKEVGGADGVGRVGGDVGGGVSRRVSC